MYNILGLGHAVIPCVVLFLALFLDFIYPYHRGIMYLIHPVHTCYAMAIKLAKIHRSKFFGALLCVFCILIHVIPVWLVLLWMHYISVILYVILASWILKCSFSIRLLLDIALNSHKYMIQGDWVSARYWAQQLVRRNVFALEDKYVISAVVESLAESLVDGIVSPLMYYPFLGVLGPYIQRLINTLDSAIGYKTPEYREVGWFSAKADTIINYIPARLTALYIIIASLVLRYDWKNSLKIYIRDRRRTESVNAGHPMSAIAGALRVKLVKPNHYELGDEIKNLEPDDILRAIRIIKVVILLHIVLVVTLLILSDALIMRVLPLP